MALPNFIMLINELLNKDPDLVSDEAPLIVLDSKSDMCMSKNGNDTNTHKAHCKQNAFLKEWRKV